MDDWDNFYMLAGGTAGTLIGLIFVVITLGMDHAQEGDTLRIRIFVTPIRHPRLTQRQKRGAATRLGATPL